MVCIYVMRFLHGVCQCRFTVALNICHFASAFVFGWLDGGPVFICYIFYNTDDMVWSSLVFVGC